MKLYLKRIYSGFGKLKRLLQYEGSKLRVLKSELISQQLREKKRTLEIDYGRLSQYLSRKSEQKLFTLKGQEPSHSSYKAESLIPKIESAAINAYNTVATMLQIERSKSRSALGSIRNKSPQISYQPNRGSRLEFSGIDGNLGLDATQVPNRLLKRTQFPQNGFNMTPTRRLEKMLSESKFELQPNKSSSNLRLDQFLAKTPQRGSSPHIPLNINQLGTLNS